MGRPGYRPIKDHHLANELGLMTHERAALRDTIRKLVNDGLIRRLKGNRWELGRESRPELTGTLSVSPQGHGMVRIMDQSGKTSEVFIPTGTLGGAMHGDLVTVELSRGAVMVRPSRESRTPSRMRPDGRITKIVQRNRRVIVGLLKKSPTYWYVIPDQPRLIENIRIPKPSGDSALIKLKENRKVVVALAEPCLGRMIEGSVIEDLGDPDAPGVDVLSVMREHEIATGFDPETEKEAKRHNIDFTGKEFGNRLDLRKEMIVTIDPADAKDHDDAVSLQRLPDGGWRLGIHIADVSHFVTPGSSTDQDALRNGNSVYMVDRFIPMLPPYLTSEVCSLKAGRDRLAYSVFVTYDRDIRVRSVEMKESLINPRILIDYDRVQKLIKGQPGHDIPAEYHENLLDMHHVASRLREQRMSRGAVDLTVPEVVCKLDTDGNPVSLQRRSAPEAYHLIEEFMLVANVAVAERLRDARVPAIYRIHEDPADEQWAQMALDLNQLGIAASPSDRHDVQRLARQYADKPLAYPVSIAVLRNFKRALYSPLCIPHFGLAFECYTHFTSPIRRYSDLVVHRILKALDAGKPGYYGRSECEEMANHCSRREREADEAEEESLIIKRLQYYEQLVSRGEIGPWMALITGGTTRGLMVEIMDTLQRGFIPSHALPDPQLHYDRETGYLIGRRGRRLGRIGDLIPVELMRVDKTRRSVDLRWIDRPSGKKGASKAEDAKSANAQPVRRRKRHRMK